MFTVKALRFALFTLSLSAARAQTAPPAGPDPNTYYQSSPDSAVMKGVPQGQVKGPFTLPSQAYPGTQHTYWVYVPAQYDPQVPASLMIFNDGQAFMAMDGDIRAQVVMDNLIYRRELPVMVGVFINPGRKPEQPEPDLKEWGDRTTNRPTEYNALDDKYARFERGLERASDMGRTRPVLRAYRSARDHAKGPTPYGRTSLSESFAEAFALFRADPAALRRVDPGAFAWFESGGHLRALAD